MASSVLFSGKPMSTECLPSLLTMIMDRQDLNCSIMTGSSRLFDHTTFAELQWRRDPFSSNIFVLSPGFQEITHLLTEGFIEVLEDMHALQNIRDSPGFVCQDTTWMLQIDNHQASLQSRIVGLPKPSLFLECCQLATYIAACQLCSKVWRSSEMPVRILRRLNSYALLSIFPLILVHRRASVDL